MKLKKRLTMAFFIISVAPVLLICAVVYGLTNYQANSFREAYGLNEQIDLISGNSMQIFNRLTQKYQQTIRQSLAEDPEKFQDPEYLSQLNQQLLNHYAYLIVRKDGALIFIGDTDDNDDAQLYSMLPEFSMLGNNVEGGIYLDGDSQHLIKQIDFLYPDQSQGTVFIVSRVDQFVPEVKSLFMEMFVIGICILVGAGILLTYWIYRSILRPLGKLQVRPRRSGTEIWILLWKWRMRMRSASCARILRRCGSA